MNNSFFYARPSWLEGLARIFDFGGVLNQYKTRYTGQEADAIAIRSDWEAIGQDLRASMGEFEMEEAERLTLVE